MSLLGGALKIEDNAILQTVGGLSALGPVGDKIDIADNPSLVSFPGLFDITAVGDDFKIEDNVSLPTVAQAEALRDAIGEANIAGAVIISGNGPG